MSDLDVLVPGLKREIAVPGQFAVSFPQTLDSDLLGCLADAFCAAQLDGFFSKQVLDIDAATITPDLSAAGGALVTIYAAERVLLVKILNTKTRASYAAGSAKYEVDNGATVLTQVLKAMRDRKDAILVQALGMARAANPIYMQDQYSDRMTRYPGEYIGVDNPLVISTNFYTYELAGP